MKTTVTFILFLTVFSFCKAQIPDLTNWKTDSLPVGNKIYSANHSQSNWVFIKTNDKWEVVQNSFRGGKGDSFPFTPAFIDKNLKEIKGGNRFVKQTPDGYLVGLNKGEFGGGLYFIKRDGLDVYEMSKYLNIHNIFNYNNKYFAIEGLAHMGGQRGQIIEIFKSDTVWKYKSLTSLIESPEIITDYKGEKIIVTSQYILKFGKDFKITQILKSPFYWGMLYPSSILVDNNNLYLAMRQGVLKITSFNTSPEYEWYIPK